MLETASTVEQAMTSTETLWRDESILRKLYWEHHLSTNEIADGFDNRPENIELLSRSEHVQQHGFGTEIRPSSEDLANSHRERDD